MKMAFYFNNPNLCTVSAGVLQRQYLRICSRYWTVM